MQVNADKYTEQKPVMMTKAEAEKFFDMLDSVLKSCVANINAIDRKRWISSEKAMAKVPFIKRHAEAEKLRQKLGEAFNIGGY